MMRKKFINYIILILYGLLLIAFFLQTNNLFGSEVDWLNQHSVFPDYFRNLFYETRTLFSNFAFNIGAGQNIFNFSYYGLFSPIILISYFLPWINMTYFVITASIILYLLSGILMSKFIEKHFDSKMGFWSGIVMLSLPPLTYQFHHHIMFVWYLPFLLMAFLGVDRYFETGKSLFLIINIFLIIMTNYYYAVACLVALVIYVLYKILSKEKLDFKNFCLESFKIGIRFLIAIFLAGIILLPTVYTITNSARVSMEIIRVKDYFLTDLSRFMFGSFGLGISGLFVIALFGNLLASKKKENLFLYLSLLLIITFPYIMFLLNGFIYIRGKILIPFIPLYIYSLVNFFKLLEEKKVDKIKLLKLILIYIVIMAPLKFKNFLCCLEILFSMALLFLCKEKRGILKIYVVITLLVASYGNNIEEKYTKIDFYNDINSESITNLLSKREDKGFYRTINNSNSSSVVNKIYDDNFYSTTMYSSTYNGYYRDFYMKDFGNNIAYRNNLIIAGSNNDFFNTFMGIKYLISNEYYSPYYQEVASDGKYKLYYNEKAYPILYVSDQLGSLKEYKKLKFPYNLEYMMNYSIVDRNFEKEDSNIKEYKSDNIKNWYIFNNLKENKEVINLPEELRNKMIYLSFNMNDNNNCSNGDTSITINDNLNTLSCKEWRYHNQNFNFKYVLPVRDSLSIKVSKGTFNISNIKIYYSDINNFNNNFSELKNIKLDKKNSSITGEVDATSDSYLISSIPFDKGFNIYVDGDLVKKEIVNTSFLGCKLKSGNHTIKIVYKAPYFNYGIIVSLIGVIGLIGICFVEINEKKWLVKLEIQKKKKSNISSKGKKKIANNDESKKTTKKKKDEENNNLKRNTSKKKVVKKEEKNYKKTTRKKKV